VNLDKVINDVCVKFSYSEELKSALKKCIPIMAEDKSEKEIQLLVKTLYNVEIFTFEKQPTRQQIEYIREKKFNNRNSHVKFGEPDLGEYNKYTNPGAYCYDIIFDKDMKAIDKSEYIYITNLKPNSILANTYGTTINLSHLMHELGHAYVAQNDPYIQDESGNVIVRDGMRKDILIVDKQNCKVSYGDASGIFIEEAMNTVEEEKFITKLLGVKSIDEIPGYEKSTYQSSVMTSLIRGYLQVLSKSKPFQDARVFNDYSKFERFERAFSQTDYSKKVQKQEYYNEKERDFLSNVPKNVEYFFKKYYGLYFSAPKKQGFLENLDNALEQMYSLSAGYCIVRLN